MKGQMEEAGKRRVLLIEDDPDDAELVQILLREQNRCGFSVNWVTSLSSGVTSLDQEIPDVCLLDLGLPDSQGLESLEAVLKLESGLPVVVLTGLDDERRGSRALALGAQDYLHKDKIKGDDLARALVYAMERARLLAKLEEYRQRLWYDQERESLELLATAGFSTIFTSEDGKISSSAEDRDFLDAMVKEYSSLLKESIENQILQSQFNWRLFLGALAMRLGKAKVGVADVILIHREALRQLTGDSPASYAEAVTREGRLMLVGLLGCLVDYFRNNNKPGGP